MRKHQIDHVVTLRRVTLRLPLRANTHKGPLSATDYRVMQPVGIRDNTTSPNALP